MSCRYTNDIFSISLHKAIQLEQKIFYIIEGLQNNIECETKTNLPDWDFPSSAQPICRSSQVAKVPWRYSSTFLL